MLMTLAIANYRSIHDLCLPLGPLNVITGANGSGKSSVYRALRLLAQAAQGRIVSSLAAEGGLSSALWAGPEEISRAMLDGTHPLQGTQRKQAIRLKLGFASDKLGYLIQLGLPAPPAGAFALDPHIKVEQIWQGAYLSKSQLRYERKANLVRAREGKSWISLSEKLASYDSLLTQLADPRQSPDLLELRECIRGWRFYDHLRSDSAAPARQAHIGSFTPVLSDDGHDLAAALQTIIEVGDEAALQRAVDDAFPGASLAIDTYQGRFELQMQQPGLLRPLSVMELSDGTLRYLLWIAALLSPRPAELLVLNEPETSLHPDLLPALGRLIINAASRSQIIVVSHARRLIAALAEHPDCRDFELAKQFGQTQILGQGMLDKPAWHWQT